MLVPVPPSPDDIAREKIKNWLNASGVAQSVFAKRIGKHQSWVSRYLAGRQNADMVTVQRMAEQFGHTLQSVLDLPGDLAEASLLEDYRALSPGLRENVRRLFRGILEQQRQSRWPRRE
jgi:transcriptional regulator with XRE-family HTH domain